MIHDRVPLVPIGRELSQARHAVQSSFVNLQLFQREHEQTSLFNNRSMDEVWDQAHQQSEDCGRSQAHLNTNYLRYVCLEVRDEGPEQQISAAWSGRDR